MSASNQPNALRAGAEQPGILGNVTSGSGISLVNLLTKVSAPTIKSTITIPTADLGLSSKAISTGVAFA